ncbi:galanin receptor 2a-like [Lytechinus variegatus]|uniref:galanin receptor 2a-like n=1 Tax=Lytechinus variegatus TaxID=7654 RepID=UPI001BB172B1|nr:galanin receptor 2a-like [Lytechinus variegatus]
MENNTTCHDFGGGDTWHVTPFERFRVLDCFFILIGIIGNSFVIYIQLSLNEARIGRDSSSTNRLVVCLAIADLCTAIFLIPVPRIVNIPNTAAGKFYCHIINSRYLLWVSFRASVYTLATIAIERFLAVAHPYTYRVWAHKKYVGYAVLAIWLCPVIIRFPMMYFRTVDECGRCRSRYPEPNSLKVYYSFLFVIEYLCPLIIILYTNTRVIAELGRGRFDQDTSDPTARQQSTQLQSARRRLTVMFIFICASFILLSTPDQFGIFLYRIEALPRTYPSTVIFDVLVAISFLNAAVANPLIYSVCLPTFRQAVKGLLMCRGIDRTRSSLMAPTTSSMATSSA